MVRPGAGESGDSSMKSALFCDMPLFSALLDANLEARHAFHMPGHRSLQSFPSDIKSRLLQLDTTELPSTADLMHPQGAAPKRWNVRLFSVRDDSLSDVWLNVGCPNNVSGCSRRGRVLLTRDVHQSVMHGIAVLGLQPLYSTGCPIRIVRRRCSDVAVCAESLKQTRMKTLFLTCPNYYGETYPLQTICDLAHRHGVPSSSTRHTVLTTLPILRTFRRLCSSRCLIRRSERS